MHKSSLDPSNEDTHDTLAQWLVWTLIINEISLYSQHIKWTENITTELLSRDFHHSDKSLTIYIQVHPPTTDSGVIPHQSTA